MKPIQANKADFTIGKYTFEVGGQNKQQKQIQGIRKKDGRNLYY